MRWHCRGRTEAASKQASARHRGAIEAASRRSSARLRAGLEAAVRMASTRLRGGIEVALRGGGINAEYCSLCVQLFISYKTTPAIVRARARWHVEAGRHTSQLPVSMMRNRWSSAFPGKLVGRHAQREMQAYKLCEMLGEVAKVLARMEGQPKRPAGRTPEWNTRAITDEAHACNSCERVPHLSRCAPRRARREKGGRRTKRASSIGPLGDPKATCQAA